MGRTIDYALTRDCQATATAHGKRGSDHRLVVYTVRAGGHRWRVGQWNIRHGRNRRRAATLAVRILELFDLDALLLCEAQDYADLLHRVARSRGHRVRQWTDAPGMAHQAILVRAGVGHSRAWCRRMTSSVWRTIRGNLTPAKYLPTLLLEDPTGAGGDLRVAIGHRPPTQRWRRGRMTGPARRVLATIDHARAEVRWLDQRPEGLPILLGADWNAEPHTGGRWSPRWVAARTGCTITAPRGSTHG